VLCATGGIGARAIGGAAGGAIGDAGWRTGDGAECGGHTPIRPQLEPSAGVQGPIATLAASGGRLYHGL